MERKRTMTEKHVLGLFTPNLPKGDCFNCEHSMTIHFCSSDKEPSPKPKELTVMCCFKNCGCKYPYTKKITLTETLFKALNQIN